VAVETGKQIAQSFSTPEGIGNNVGQMVILGGVSAIDAPVAEAPVSPKPVPQTTMEPPATNSPAAGSTPASASGNTLKLPASMADELPAYQQAAQDGSLVKTQSSTLPRSQARQMWEDINGPVPDGFDVDHIIQRQHGGADDISNLQLKPSSLNRSQGAQAMHLNKADSYGTKYDSVDLQQ